MIATLRGVLAEKALDHVVVDVGGVGYLVLVSMQTLAELPQAGQEVQLLCHTHVREDALALYGFVAKNEREVFTLLIGVSGIGPKLALTILSGLPVDRLVMAISSGDHKRLQAIPGVGKKTAERLVVELKEKVTKAVRLADISSGATPAPPSDTKGEIVEALTNLGYKRNQAEKAVAQVLEKGAELATEEALRRALAAIAQI